MGKDGRNADAVWLAHNLMVVGQTIVCPGFQHERLGEYLYPMFPGTSFFHLVRMRGESDTRGQFQFEIDQHPVETPG